MILGCSSHRTDLSEGIDPSLPPPTMEDCKQIESRILARNRIYKSLRGQARLNLPEGALDLEVAVLEPNYLRAEVVGPLGVRVALFIINPTWVLLYVPRENTVFRLPSEEFLKNSQRRELFLKDIPFPAVPEILVPALLTQVPIGVASAKRSAIRDCIPETDSRALRVDIRDRVPGQLGGWRRYWLDPLHAGPVRIQYFGGSPDAQSNLESPEVEIKFRQFRGEAIGRFPLAAEFTGKGVFKGLEWDWKDVEVWQDPRKEGFEWRPRASVFVKEF